MVGMSGGVDSSVTAALLKELGHQVSGVTMRLRASASAPASEEGIESAREVAQALGIRWQVIDVSPEYQREVIRYFCREYLAGRTPNPCMACNRYIKFGAFLARAREAGFDFDCFATGHYAHVELDSKSGRYILRKGAYEKKDQSYFLAFLSQEQLGHCVFPLGGYAKAEVRKIAAGLGLRVAERPESQDFACGGFSPELLGPVPRGPLMDKGGNILGEHRGIPFYTIGQRHGLGLSSAAPLYVTSIDAGKQAVIVGGREDIYSDELEASGMNWIAMLPPTTPFPAKAKIRYRHTEAEALVTPLDDNRVNVKFHEPQMAITPGQAVVLYRGDVVLGGGIIESSGHRTD